MTDSSYCVFRYMNGAATNPDAHVVAYAGAQVKKGLEIAKRLGAENYGELGDSFCLVFSTIIFYVSLVLFDKLQNI